MIIDEDEYIEHYGTPRHSGRYPWGSGEDYIPHPRNASFLDTVEQMRKQGLSPKDIADGMGISTTQLRARTTIERNRQKQEKIITAQRLKEKGMSNGAIAKQMGLPGESSVRALLDPSAKDRADVLLATSDMLRREVNDKKFVDVGSGVENYVNISKEKLGAAVDILKEEGYVTHPVKVPQRGTQNETTVKVLTLPGTTWGEAQKNKGNIQQITAVSEDGGHSFSGKKRHAPVSINSNRIDVRYAEQGGNKADGVIYVRPGVPDVSLGKNRYAQVRVKVDDSHFLKGMAMYKDGLPAGVDLQFNTNKSSTGNKHDAFKPLSKDPDFPFESVVRPLLVNPGSHDEHVVSAMNIVNEQGSWHDWSKNLSSQFLSKQSPSLAKSQLEKTKALKQQEFDEISALTNPTVKKKLLEKFASGADSSAVQLKAASLSSRQAWRAILPLETLNQTQVYAPGFKDGERVVLVRYPHGGTFEIPELVVNNKHAEGRKLIGDAPGTDAIGIHPAVAQRLSGADFDGDTVIVIPNNSGRVRTTRALDGLKNFDPMKYKLSDDYPRITSDTKAHLMGDVSNLITDMTIRLAPHEHIERAVKHSMVVIDAEKHNLDYKQSAIDHNIKALKTEYQGGPKAGASTLISRKKTEDRGVPHRKPRPYGQGGPVDTKTGRLVFVPSGKTRFDRRTGERVLVTQRVNRLADTPDAHTLSSHTPIEKIYADHSNQLKAMANKARLSAIKTPTRKQSASAKKTYHNEVDSLNAKLALAKRNRPRERQAQVIANAAVKAKLDANPHLDKDSLKKIGFEELEIARTRMETKKNPIDITPNEWDAIQAGALSNNKLNDILDNTDLEVIKMYATPRHTLKMTPTNTNRARAMLNSGATRAEVAAALGVSVSTLDRSLTE